MCVMLLCYTAWDPLRIDVYSFRAFSEWFFKTYNILLALLHQYNFLNQLVQSILHNAGGKLDSVNYSTARAAHLVKQTVITHHSKKVYGDENLNCNTSELRTTKEENI